MKKRFLSLVFALLLLVGATSTYAMEEVQPRTYLTVSNVLSRANSTEVNVEVECSLSSADQVNIVAHVQQWNTTTREWDTIKTFEKSGYGYLVYLEKLYEAPKGYKYRIESVVTTSTIIDKVTYSPELNWY